MMSYLLSTTQVQPTAAVLTRGQGVGATELTCASLTARAGKDKSQGYCTLSATPQGNEIGIADLTGKNLFLRIKTTANPNGELEGPLVLPQG